MGKIGIDYKNVLGHLDSQKINANICNVLNAKETLVSKTGAGNDFLGWVDWPKDYDYEEVNAIIEASKKINEECDTLVVCGIGGSYLGAASAIEMLNGLFSDSKVKIIFMGNTFSSTYTAQVLKYLEDKEFTIRHIKTST